MTSGGHRGCQGAIWGNGDPASKYCKDDDRFPWWQNCCTWKWGSYWNPITKLDTDGNSCHPKSGKYYSTKKFDKFLLFEYFFKHILFIYL